MNKQELIELIRKNKKYSGLSTEIIERELQELEPSRLLYTQRQNVELYREKVSLEPFEARFREVFRL